MLAEQVHSDDLEVIRAIQRGDQHALASLYDRYKSILFGLILRILHSQAEAEDVLQEVFMQAWQRASSYDESRGKPFAWLVTLARSRAIDRLRALESRGRTASEAVRGAVDNVSDAVEDTLRSEQNAIVTEAMSQLPSSQRGVLLMAYFEGLTQSEIAEKMHEPLGTIKTRMRTGTLKLREIIGGRLADLI